MTLATSGVNRLSMGAQSFDPALLRRLGRRHAPSHVADAVLEARAGGIASVSVDLLYDVPGQSVDAFAASLDAAIELGVDHVSAYALTLDDPDAEGITGPAGDHLPSTRGARRWRDGARPEQDDDRAADQYRLAVDRLAAAGLSRLRDLELGPARPREPAQPGLLDPRSPTRRSGPGAHAFDGARDAGTRRASMGIWPRSPRRAARRRSRRATRSRSTRPGPPRSR